MPTRLNVAVVGEGSYPQVLVMAGSGLQPSKMVFAAYQLVYADSTVVIDSTLPEQSYEGMFPTSPFDSQAYESIQKALQQSSLILLTHAHLDHIEGITRSPDAVTLVPKMFFTEEQMRDASTGVGMTAKLLDLTKTTRYEGYYSPAPGVVMMKSAGHSPGDQLIYVQLQGGIEFLLTGDVVGREHPPPAVPEHPQPSIAVVAQQATNGTRVVVVVDGQRLDRAIVGDRSLAVPADGAYTILPIVHVGIRLPVTP